jgi:hypothetical protein
MTQPPVMTTSPKSAPRSAAPPGVDNVGEDEDRALDEAGFRFGILIDGE